ncbi:MAG TPA: GyrI-like domain-containing protein [Candidatus Saccharimonadales bacterium]|nr:GyrI-like domain-containing protein [Candidatus Saccharimonadales bacterium]
MINFKNAPAFRAKLKPDFINVPPILFIKVDGSGSPANKDFQEALKTVYGIFYTIKLWGKKHDLPEGYEDFTTAPLEAIWWTGVGQEFEPDRPQDWRWTALMRLPDFVTREFFDEAVNELVEKKKTEIYKKARLENMHEGCCAQILHIGPYDQQMKSLEKLYKFVADNGYEIYGRHHEIYMNDPNRNPPEKLKTVLRYPVRKRHGELEIISNSVVG